MYKLLLYASQLSGQGVWGKTGGCMGPCRIVGKDHNVMRHSRMTTILWVESNDAATSPHVISQVYSFVQGMFTT